MATEMTPDEIARASAAYFDELSRLGYATSETSKAFFDAKVGIRGFTSELERSKYRFEGALRGYVESLSKYQAGISNVNNVISSAGDGLSVLVKGLSAAGGKLAIAANIASTAIAGLSKAATIAVSQIDILAKSYDELARVGASGAGGLEETFKTVQKFGYSLDEASKLASMFQENAAALQAYGGSILTGKNKFAELNNVLIRNSLPELKNLGMNLDDINRSSLAYVQMQAQLGNKTKFVSLSVDEQAKAIKNYIVEQDAITKLTGATRQDQEAARKAALAEEAFRAKQVILAKFSGEQGKKEADERDKIIRSTASLGPEIQRGIKDILATGRISSDEAEAINRATGGKGLAILTDASKSSAQRLEDLSKALGPTVYNLGTLSAATQGASGFGRTFPQFLDAAEIFSEAGKQQKEITKQQAAIKDTPERMLKANTDLVVANINSRQALENLTLVLSKEAVPVLSLVAKGLNEAAKKGGGLAYSLGEVRGAAGAEGGRLIGESAAAAAQPAAGTSRAQPQTSAMSPELQRVLKSAEATAGKQPARPELISLAEKLVAASNENGWGIRITAMNDAYHTSGKHASGEALDFTFGSAIGQAIMGNTVFASDMVSKIKSLGFSDVLDEYNKKSPGWTAPHFHAELKDGGVVMQDTIARLGEAGPEVVQPLGPGGLDFVGMSKAMTQQVDLLTAQNTMMDSLLSKLDKLNDTSRRIMQSSQ